jgi:S1-C subfamily serine protease
MIQAVVVVNGTRYTVPQQGLRIGRAPENDVVLPDPNVSRQHLVIWSTPRGAFLRDLGSQNGTYIAGRRLGSGPEAIPTGARVRIGVTDIEIEVREGTESSSAPVGSGGYAGGETAGQAGVAAGPGGQAPGPYGTERRPPQVGPQHGNGAAGPYGGQPPYAGPGPAAQYNRPPGRPPGGGPKTGLIVGGIIGVLILAMFGTGVLVLRAVADSRATPTPTVSVAAATPTTAATPVSKPVAIAASSTPAPKPTDPPAKPSVPTLTVAPAKPTTPPEQPKPSGGRDPAFVRALNSSVRVIVPTGPSSASTGSGSIISARGHILTNYHVVSDETTGKLINGGNNIVIAVPPNEGDPAQPKYRAKVVDVDTKLDLAIIQLTALENGAALPSNLGLNPIPIGSSKSVNIGDTIIIIGFPGLGGSSLTVTRGIHSGIARFSDDPGSFIKTDTEINRGNSGGTAINAAGELIGIPTAGRFDREAPGKIGLVRPIDEARTLLDKFTR